MKKKATARELGPEGGVAPPAWGITDREAAAPGAESSPPVVKLPGQKAHRPGASGPESEDCQQCAELRLQVRELRELREASLLSLARAQEALTALRASYPPPTPTTEEPPAPLPLPAAPLRHLLVDQANEFVKTRLRPLHRGTKLLLVVTGRLGSLLREQR
jgi:hypothetical protein